MSLCSFEWVLSEVGLRNVGQIMGAGNLEGIVGGGGGSGRNSVQKRN